jgi:DNA-directed RNA polymerase subunit beta'
MRKIAQGRDNVVVEARRIEAEQAAALAAPASSDDVVGGDVFDTMVVDTPQSRDE